MPKKYSTKRKIVIVVALCCLLIGGILYQLADRYLIEHVEVVVAADTVSSAAKTINDSSASSSNSSEVVSDDWNYSSDDTTISIKKVITGSGSDQITYYVADVQVSDASLIQSAFADNSFGRNITEDTSDIAADHKAVFAINGDYYGFRSDGVIIRNGILYRNEPAREAVALYADGTMAAYDEEEVSAETLLANGVLQTLSFGPALIQNGKLVQDLDNVKIDTNFGNRSISSSNPRTGIGMISPNHYVFVVVDGRSDESRGMTLDEFAQVFDDLGATEAYNLDGGGSSTMYFMGRVVNNPQGKQEERGVSDILYLGEG
ncbi:phosphodiester glycosidase family protein [Paenibacillus sp. 19GGS1-52]|uniref:phosphodiester glycosidase family protein n=1 Tax=Paenibacillus sp. 19GGS1-52 TaxID=2758563 RepID=UPI001EFA6238|nr:phosphodiester glycosidase family protein [Paenibacillus sp. 19GGS1-52]ULO06210.1 phosphodiester glycosidase family protein [Paenibacillus sp. 19GGS1-52]